MSFLNTPGTAHKLLEAIFSPREYERFMRTPVMKDGSKIPVVPLANRFNAANQKFSLNDTDPPYSALSIHVRGIGYAPRLEEILNEIRDSEPSLSKLTFTETPAMWEGKYLGSAFSVKGFPDFGPENIPAEFSLLVSKLKEAGVLTKQLHSGRAEMMSAMTAQGIFEPAGP